MVIAVYHEGEDFVDDSRNEKKTPADRCIKKLRSISFSFTITSEGKNAARLP